MPLLDPPPTPSDSSWQVREEEPSSSPLSSATACLKLAVLLILFVDVLLLVINSAPTLYFYRTGYACDASDSVPPGERGWSGSIMCADAAAVIGSAQRLSAWLGTVQLCTRSLATPLLTAIADRTGYLRVAGLGTCFTVLAFMLNGVAAQQLSVVSAGTDDSQRGFLTQLLPVVPLILARAALGVAGASMVSPLSALFLGLAPDEVSRSRYMTWLLITRCLAASIGVGVGLMVVRLYLTDYCSMYFSLTAVAAAVCVSTLALAIRESRKCSGEREKLPICSCFLGVRESLYDLISRRDLRIMMLSLAFLNFGSVGSASILASYVQTAFQWRQGRFETLMIALGAPSGLAAALCQRLLLRPKLGQVGTLQVGFASIALGMCSLCFLPWFEAALYFFIVFLVAGITTLPTIFLYVAEKIPQRLSAQALGMIEISIVAAIGAAVPSFSYMYHADATRKEMQAVPFIVGASTGVLGTMTILMLDNTLCPQRQPLAETETV